jgi:hypothetical protein
MRNDAFGTFRESDEAEAFWGSLFPEQAPVGLPVTEELDVSRAVQRNRILAARLGWASRHAEIVRLLGGRGSPSPEAFAGLVYDWQQREGLSPDGIIGPVTWRRIQAQLSPGDPTSRPRSTSSVTPELAALVARARARFNVPEGGFSTGRQQTDFFRGRSLAVSAIMDAAARDPEASRRQIARALQAFATDPSVHGRDIPIDLAFAVAKLAREGGPDLAFSTSTELIVSSGRDTHPDGRIGFDYLWNIRSYVPNYNDRLQPVTTGLIRPQARPARLQQRDALIAGIAYARRSEAVFLGHVREVFSDYSAEERQRLLSRLSRDAKRAWVQSTFGTPGYSRLALQYLARRSTRETIDLDAILTDPELVAGRHAPDPSRSRRVGFSIGRARVTAGESWMLEQLGFVTRYAPGHRPAGDGTLGPTTGHQLRSSLEPGVHSPVAEPSAVAVPTLAERRRRSPQCYEGTSTAEAAILHFPVRYPRGFSGRLIWFGASFCAPRSSQRHHAIDIMGEEGMEILATSRQTVVDEWAFTSNGQRLVGSGVRLADVRTGPQAGHRGGNSVRTIDDQGFVHYYAHMRDAPLVRPGQVIAPGQVIGYLGQTGVPGTPHLHYQIRAPQPAGSERLSVEIGGRRYSTRGGAAVDPYDVLVRLALAATPPARRRGRHSAQLELPLPVRS